MGLRIIYFLASLVIAASAYATNTKDEDMRQRVYRQVDGVPPVRVTSSGAKANAEKLDYQAKQAEAIAEAYRHLANEARKKALQSEDHAERTELVREDWDIHSIKGKLVYQKYVENCLGRRVMGRTAVERCIAQELVRRLGIEPCSVYQSQSKKHSYAARHCYDNLRHALAKCLSRKNEHFDYVSCVERQGHFAYFNVNVEEFRTLLFSLAEL